MGGRKPRSYAIAYDGKTQEITFVLEGRKEHQLSAAGPRAATTPPCRGLLTSFVLR